jgi:FkbM family methyltransferase
MSLSNGDLDEMDVWMAPKKQDKISGFRSWLASHAPWLGPLRRHLRARYDSLRACGISYSQHGEDALLLAELRDYDLRDAIYVDVGANHPTDISNTYLFYRRGHFGVTIEPNQELARLHRRFRPRDIVVPVGCGKQAQLASFEISKTPGLSRFERGSQSDSAPKGELWRKELLPILTLDTVLEATSFQWIFLLSIDVEGLDLEVLEGAPNALSKTLFLCIEANDGREKEVLTRYADQAGFDFARAIGCNVVFKNRSSRFDHYRSAPDDVKRLGPVFGAAGGAEADQECSTPIHRMQSPK